MTLPMAPTLLLMIALSCGSQGAGTSESPQAVHAAMSPAASAYLSTILKIMEARSVNRKTIDWADFRSKVLAAAGSAQTVPDLYPAIALALQLLGDQHSNYLTNAGRPITRSGKGCNAGGPTIPRVPALPEGIGYVRVPPFSGTRTEANRFAESLQRAIQVADRPDLTGWIVDLRGNFGGSMWPMIAGVSPILGDGIVGYSISADGREEVWEYRAGAFHLEGAVYRYVDTQYALVTPHPRVAVLTDRTVTSSGEGVVVAFRERPDTRSFGTATCGLSTGNTDFPLSDGAILVLTESVMADRTRKQYGQSIPPDETIEDPEAAIRRAVAWLQGKI